MKKILKIGTRASPLAVAQAEAVAQALKLKHPDISAEIVKIVTSGDKTQAGNRPLSESGNKGLFTKEIEDALIAKDIDCAVHSMKDMPGLLPEGLVISCLLPRGDPRDAFLSHKAKTLDDLPHGATVGTASVRRQAIILSLRPDLKVVTFRGNIDTRLKKLKDGVVDAAVLGLAGLERIGLGSAVASIFDPDIMLPAVAQGAVGVEIRADDAAMRELLSAVHCSVTELRVTAERAYLAVLDGSCRTPLAALMEEPDPEGRARLWTLAASPDGRVVRKHSYMMSVKHAGDAQRLGDYAGREMKKTLPKGFV